MVPSSSLSYSSTIVRLQLITLAVVALAMCIAPSNQSEHASTPGVNAAQMLSVARSLMLEGNTASIARKADALVLSMPEVRSSVPLQLIYECIREHSLLRCAKLYLLERLETHKHLPHSANLSKDFIELIAPNTQPMGSLISTKCTNMTEKELNQRLGVLFRRFFKHRDIKLHFLPGILVKIVPSKENKLRFSLKKTTKPKREQRSYTDRRSPQEPKIDASDNASLEPSSDPPVEGSLKIGGVGGAVGASKRKRRRPYSYKSAIIQMAVPVMVLPAILMGSFLPFVLPFLKMATIMTLILNNSAFMAALIYAARTQANAQEEQPISYTHPGFH